MTRKALGRGLSALIREVEETPAESIESGQLAIELIDPNPFQPRAAFSDERLGELAASIRASGVIQPVLVRKKAERYQLVAGERRWRAAKLAGLETIPAVVRELDDTEALELALAENLLRDDLNPVEVARGYNALQEQFHLSHEQIAEKLGISRVAVTNTLRLLRLPGSVLAMVEAGSLSAGHARALLSLESPADQERWAQDVAKRGLSVRQVEEKLGHTHEKRDAAEAIPQLDPNLRAAVLELERILGTRVRITGNGENGSIQIRYYSPDDLTRIFDAIIPQS